MGELRIAISKVALGAGTLTALGVMLSSAVASAQVVETHVRATLFHEGSPTSPLTVVTPKVDLGVNVTDAINIHAAYEADIVTGASESLKAGPLTNVDVVSSATDFDDVRHVVGGGFTLTRENTNLSANYSYGTEEDYRSHAIAVSAGTDFLQKNTEIVLSYARGFDDVCTSAYRTSDAASLRLALDSSKGCFTNADNRATRDIDIDTAQVAWTQSWTPVFNTQFVLSGSLQSGFLSSPYRSVVIAPAGDSALEHEPENRARGAAALRGKYFFRSLDAALGIYARIYRDTWDILGQTYEIEGEKYLTPSLRLLLRGRYYTQNGALFWSNDYTGGEPETGPRGQYWTGDRELSPLHSYGLGGRLLYSKDGSPGDRVLGMLLQLQSSIGAELVKTDLEEFTWGRADPDDTLAAILSVGLGGQF